MLYFFTAPLKWVVGCCGSMGGCGWEKNTASEPRKILALAFVRWDIFSG
ncbi:MAG: hypothetical protein RBR78_09480 [Flavobacteriaceae bacterium]|nr:hypothetical protein [Flavobacteriaceae bacterium]